MLKLGERDSRVGVIYCATIPKSAPHRAVAIWPCALQITPHKLVNRKDTDIIISDSGVRTAPKQNDPEGFDSSGEGGEPGARRGPWGIRWWRARPETPQAHPAARPPPSPQPPPGSHSPSPAVALPCSLQRAPSWVETRPLAAAFGPPSVWAGADDKISPQ